MVSNIFCTFASEIKNQFKSMKLFVLIFGSILLIFYFGYYSEKKRFNNGICPKCGTPLRHFDNDSQGGQGWRCDKCDYVTWISWFKR